MCVIIVKEKNVKMPPLQTLKEAAQSNPHGFGFCTSNRLFKTLDFEEFIAELKTVKINENCIIHFRYATQGSVKTSNCHPFKNNDICFAHNGHLNIETKYDMTDSETFFISVTRAINAFGYDSTMFENFMAEYSYFSKFALLKDDKIRLFGDFHRVNGLYYSNLRFLNTYYYEKNRF